MCHDLGAGWLAKETLLQPCVWKTHTTSFRFMHMFQKHKTQVVSQLHPNQGHMLLAHWEDGFLSGALRGSFQCFCINLAMESVPWLWRRVSEVSRDQQCGLFPVRSDFVVFIWCLFATQLHIETGLPSAPTQLPRPSPASDADSDSWSSCLMSFRRLPFPFESPGVRQQLL